MFDIEATHARELDGPDRWLAGVRGGTGLGHAYETHGQGNGRADDQLEGARAQLAEDRGANPAGAFTKLQMTLAPEWRDTVRGLEPEAAGRRMLEAAKRAISSELPRHQGVLTLVRDGHESMPAVQAVLSPRLRDGGTAPLLGRPDVARLEAKWDRAVQVAFGLTRGLEPARRPDPPREHELRTEMDRAVKRFMDVMGARMRGEVGQAELRDAATEAEKAANAYRTAHLHAAPELLRQTPQPTPELGRDRGGPPLGAERPASAAADVLRLRIEGGYDYLQRLDPQDIRTVLQRAAEAAAGRAGLQARIETVSSNADRDLQVFVLCNHRAPSAAREVDPRHVATALVTHLRAEISENAKQYDSRRAGTVGELGRVDLVEPAGERRHAPDDLSRADVAPHPASGRAVGAHAQSAVSARSLDSFEVSLRLARGSEYLAAVPAEKRPEVIRAAVERAFPFLTEQRPAAHFAVVTDGSALRVRVTIPRLSGWTREQLQRPLFQFRFAHEIQRAYIAHGGGRKPLAALPGPGRVGGLLRTIGRCASGVVDASRLVHSPGRTLAESALFSRIPSPLRAIRSISRALGFLRQQDE